MPSQHEVKKLAQSYDKTFPAFNSSSFLRAVPVQGIFPHYRRTSPIFTSGVMRLYPIDQPLPGHDLIHHDQETLFIGLPAYSASANSVRGVKAASLECQCEP